MPHQVLRWVIPVRKKRITAHEVLKDEQPKELQSMPNATLKGPELHIETMPGPPRKDPEVEAPCAATSQPLLKDYGQPLILDRAEDGVHGDGLDNEAIQTNNKSDIEIVDTSGVHVTQEQTSLPKDVQPSPNALRGQNASVQGPDRHGQEDFEQNVGTSGPTGAPMPSSTSAAGSPKPSGTSKSRSKRDKTKHLSLRALFANVQAEKATQIVPKPDAQESGQPKRERRTDSEDGFVGDIPQGQRVTNRSDMFNLSQSEEDIAGRANARPGQAHNPTTSSCAAVDKETGAISATKECEQKRISGSGRSGQEGLKRAALRPRSMSSGWASGPRVSERDWGPARRESQFLRTRTGESVWTMLKGAGSRRRRQSAEGVTGKSSMDLILERLESEESQVGKTPGRAKQRSLKQMLGALIRK